MSHAFHESLPGYDKAQIWVDGCDECEWRGRNLPHGIAVLDPETFKRALERSNIYGWRPEMLTVSAAERELLSVLAILMPRLAAHYIRGGFVAH
jgi:hypothetical protein